MKDKYTEIEKRILKMVSKKEHLERDIYKELGESLGISRQEAKMKYWDLMYNSGKVI